MNNSSKPCYLVVGLIIALFNLNISVVSASLNEDQVQQPISVNYKIITDVTETGQKVSAIAVEYEDNVLANTNLKQTFEVKVTLNQIDDLGGVTKTVINRTIIAAYTNNKPEQTQKPKTGKYIIIELDPTDSGASTYKIKKENEQPLQFREYDQNGLIILKDRVQTRSVPQFYNDKLAYTINQRGYIKLANGKTINKNTGGVTGEQPNVINHYIDGFAAGSFADNTNKNNKIDYLLYKPGVETGKKYPLVVFLHGSGQVGTDNIAHVLSSKGATTWRELEEQSYILAPQCPAVFDEFDLYNEKTNTGGGIHWQSKNRRELILAAIDQIIIENKNIDTNRIYIQGLSRGAEGVLYLLLDRPQFFAGALLMSGREAYTIEWIDGKATEENIKPIKDVPMWFFHSKEDTVSPVKGSRINVELLKRVGASNLRYTEFTTTSAKEAAGDNGIVNNNAHNTWDAVYNSPEIKQWLFEQKLSK